MRPGLIIAVLSLSACLGPLHAIRAEAAAEKLIPGCKQIQAVLDENEGWLWRAEGCGKTVWCLYGGSDMHCVAKRPDTDRTIEQRKRLSEAIRRAGEAGDMLRCPPDQVRFDDFNFERGDPLWDNYDWVESEAFGCGRVAWCGQRGEILVCKNTADFDTAAAQLALETQCPVEQIDQVQRQVFSRRTWDAQRREVRGQVSWRLTACGHPYVCAVTAGLSSSVACKAALDTAAPPQPATDELLPPPPPPP